MTKRRVPSNNIFLKHKCNIQCVADVDETQGKYTCTDCDHGDGDGDDDDDDDDNDDNDDDDDDDGGGGGGD